MRRIVAVLVLAIAPALVARATTSEPHSFALEPNVSCTSCHTLHSAPGVSLTSVAGNANLCASCHNQPGLGASFGFPWFTTDQATPGTGGRSHRWDASPTNPALGADTPLNTSMAAKLDTTDPANPKLQCSTCHDQHNASASFGGTQQVSIPVATDLVPTSGSGSGLMRVIAPASNATAKAYMVEIVTGGNAATATYRLSNDGGRTWFGWDNGSSSWVTYSTSPANARVTGASQYLNDTTKVAVTFSGTGFVTGDRWRFYVSYPLLRASAVKSGLCEDCHRSMLHTSISVSGNDPARLPNVGSNTFSHPVGETLNSNAGGYDRAIPLGADGQPQGVVPANRTDLKLDVSDNTVRCLTCHSVHNAPSNSLAGQP